MSLAAIESLLNQKIGLDSTTIGSNTIKRAVEHRCSACGLPNINTYLQMLQSSPQEFAELVEKIVVPETYFFRDGKSFDFLINFVRSEWAPSSSNSVLRLLSVPCSTGEEPYSMAIALIEAGLPTNRFRIDAVDISKCALDKAKRGIYGKNSFRGKEFIDKSHYFQQTQEGYEVNSSVRSIVTFRQNNILNASAFNQARYDIIFCRNLLIYLAPSACAEVFNILNKLLLPQGLLFVGAAETGKVPSNYFTSIRQSFTFAYRKVEMLKTSPPTPLNIGEGRKYTPPSLERVGGLGSSHKEIEISLLNNKPDTPLANNSKLNLEVARQLADEGQVETAINYCYQYINYEQTNADAYALLGTLHQAKTQNSQAEKYFQKALYLNPNCYEALINLALLKEHRGDVVGASILQQRIQKILETGFLR